MSTSENTEYVEQTIPKKWETNNELSSPLLCVAFKILIALISFAIFVLLQSLLVFANLTSNADLNGFGEMIIPYVEVAGVIVCIVIVLTVFYCIARMNGPSRMEKLFCTVYQVAAFILLFIVFTLCCIVQIIFQSSIGNTHMVTTITLVISFTLISFIPIAATWHVKNEERLKNFIDAFSKACSCLTVIVGAIVVIGKMLV